MKSVYQAANSTDAHIVKNLLEQEDIMAVIRGEYLQGGLGDLPVHGLIQVCVAGDDVDRARVVIREWQDMPVPDDPDDAESGSAAPDEAGDDALQARTNAPRKPAHGKVLLALLIGTAFGAAAVWAGTREPAHSFPSDRNGDGKPDEISFFEGGLLKRIDIDRNFDGQADEVVYYRDGIVSRGENDDDFDGRFETHTRFLHGNWQSMETDRDGDGAIDYRADAINGVTYSEEWLDVERVIKREIYRNGWPVRGEIDADGDGMLDTVRHYNALREIESTQPLGR